MKKGSNQATYQEILRELRKSAVDGEEFIGPQREIEGPCPLRQQRPLLVRAKKEHLLCRPAPLAEWEDAKVEKFWVLDRAAQEVGKRLVRQMEAKSTV